MNPFPAFIEGIGGPELMMIMFIILLLFGADKLPGLAKGIGKSVRGGAGRAPAQEIPTPPAPRRRHPAGRAGKAGATASRLISRRAGCG